MATTSTVIWRPEALTARLIAAAVPARLQWATAARSRCSSKRVAASVKVLGESVVATDPLAPIIEGGSGPHEIAPQPGKPLRLADGSFVAGPVRHPGTKAQPFLRPTLPLWPSLYRRAAMGAFRGL